MGPVKQATGGQADRNRHIVCQQSLLVSYLPSLRSSAIDQVHNVKHDASLTPEQA
jgi:hypothetical protein